MIFAGSGGQGILTLGKILAEAAMGEGRQVTYFPAYGTEVRGGTAHCHVVVSDEEIFSPIVEQATAMLIMNQPSLERFLPRLSPNGLLVLNSSLVERMPDKIGEAVALAASDLANEKLGDVRVANMILLGALLALRPLASFDEIAKLMEKKLSAKRAELIQLNHKALELGAKLVKRSKP